MRYFDRLHPMTAFVYLLFAIAITMFTLNPYALCISMLCAICFCGICIGAKKLFVSLAYSLPLMIIVAMVNPIFVHKGDTILFFLNDNPVTKEAILYGVSSSMMLFSVYYWCKAYTEIMTSDKFIYLFGRTAPKLSLVLSMVIGFIPKFKKKFKQIDEAQKALGIYSSKSYVDKIGSKFRVLSILLTSALENSIMTADSMRARGYGLKGRTSFSVFHWTAEDIAVLICTLALGIGCVVLNALKFADVSFYPVLKGFEFGVKECVVYALYAAIFALSLVLEIKDEIKWHCLKLKI